MAERPSTVIFDLGGVLIDWNPRHLYRALFAGEAEMEHFLAEVCAPAWNLEMDRGRPFAEGVAELVARHPEMQELIEAYHLRWIEMIKGPISGTVELLEELHGRGVPLLALTNWSAETFPLVRDDPAYAFLGRFQRIFVSGSLAMIKPERDIFDHLLAETGLEAASCLFVDDNEANVAAASGLGFFTHRFVSPGALRHALAGHRLLG
jgi:2-haloacid dehalogenase